MHLYIKMPDRLLISYVLRIPLFTLQELADDDSELINIGTSNQLLLLALFPYEHIPRIVRIMLRRFS